MASPLFKKLNLGRCLEILVLNAPETFEPELKTLDEVTIARDAKLVDRVEFSIAFVRTLAEVDQVARLILPKAVPDAIVWFCYPKGTSKRYTCEFNRDTGWQALQSAGFDTVRAVSIDQDWSALRFRRKEFINR